MILLGYAATLLMGIVLGVVGSGGSILTVPILVYLFGIAPATATGYSLLIVGATAAFGALRYLRQNLVDLKVASVFAVPSIIAVYFTRLYIMPNIPDVLFVQPVLITKDSGLMMLFAMLMLASAFFMLRNRPSTVEPESIPVASHSLSGKDYILLVIEGAVIGVLTGMLGAGGGFIIIPTLVLILKMPMKQAIGASLYIVALKSLLGFTGDLHAGIELNWQILPFILVSTFLGMALSTRIAKKLSGRALQTYFGFFTLTIASLIIIKELL
ncbi:MAG: sulfite exporter TauE/SafE family protein [Aestuariibacter sp.]